MSDDSFAGKKVPGNLRRYKLRRLLGRGGLGEVYEAEDTQNGDRFAIKLLTHEFYRDRRGFEQALCEAASGTRIRHAHLAHTREVIDLRKFEDWPPMALAMDLFPITLAAVLNDLEERRKPLPGLTVTRLSDQLVDAVHALHRFGLVHRDIKPQNTFLSLPAGQAYVLVECIEAAKIELGDFSVVSEIGSLPSVRLKRDQFKPSWLYDSATGSPLGNVRAHPGEDVHAVGVILQRMARAGM